MMGGMEKTTVYLTTDQKRALERAAHAVGRSEARLIREGVEAVTATSGAHGDHNPAPRWATDGSSASGDRDALARRPRWMPRDELVRLLGQSADPGLRAELRRLAPDTTDDERIP